jgi:cob(I)alamin adenosyltransferase
MKIYTKTGDKGTTALIGGKRVAKHHIRIDAYGTVDELLSHIGLLRDMLAEAHERTILLTIQERLMVVAAELATDNEHMHSKVPAISDSDIELLENEIDNMNEKIPTLQSFIIPGGHVASSQCHVARTVCRRAERIVLKLSDEFYVPEKIIIYVNRLSDYLFTLARFILQQFKADEILWLPKLEV